MTPLDENNTPSPLSDAVAWQFYQEFTPVPTLLWAGRPLLNRAYWVRITLLLLLAVGLMVGSLYGWSQAVVSGLLEGLLLVAVVFINGWGMLMILGLRAFTKKLQSSYYAFDEQQLYVYSSFINQMETYSLATLPDFTLQPHTGGTTTLRTTNRFHQNSTGNSYKTPVLYCLHNGKAVLDYLQTIQAQAKETAAQTAATPSWLPRD